MVSNSYDDGYNKNPYSGRDWDGYMSGRSARQDYETKTQWNSSGKSAGGFTPPDGSAGDGLGKLLLVLFVIVIAIPTVVSALIGGFIIYLISKAGLNWFTPLPFPGSFTTAFRASIAYVVTAVIMFFLLVWLVPGVFNYNIAWDINPAGRFSPVQILQANPLPLALVHAPCLLIAALIIKKGIQESFGGGIGYLRAVLIAGIAILPAIAATVYLVFRLGAKYNLF